MSKPDDPLGVLMTQDGPQNILRSDLYDAEIRRQYEAARQFHTLYGGNSPTRMRIGDMVITEDDLRDLLELRDFMRHLIATDENIRNSLIAYRAKQRITG